MSSLRKGKKCLIPLSSIFLRLFAQIIQTLSRISPTLHIGKALLRTICPSYSLFAYTNNCYS